VGATAAVARTVQASGIVTRSFGRDPATIPERPESAQGFYNDAPAKAVRGRSRAAMDRANQRARERRAEKKAARVEAEAKKIRGVPLERGDEAVPGVPLERNDDPAVLAVGQGTPLETLALQATWDQDDERRRRERADKDAKNDQAWAGLSPEERAEKKRKVDQGRKSWDDQEAKRRAGELAKRSAAPAVPGGPPLSAMEMTPGELARLPVGPAGAGGGGRGGVPPAASTPAGPGGGAGPGGVDWVNALKANTVATQQNTQALRGIRLDARTGVGRGDPDSYGNLTSTKTKRNLFGKSDDAERFLNATSGVAGTAAGAGAAGILGLVSAISPSAISTLSDSFGLLAGEIGKSFVPAIMDAAKGLQDAWKYVAGLDDGLKSGLARVVTFSVVGLGGLAIATRVLALRFAVVTASARLFLGTLNFISAHPILTTVSLLTAGLVTATGQWENLGSAAGKALGIMADGTANTIRAIGEIGKTSVADVVKTLPEAMQRGVTQPDLTPAQRAERIAGYRKDTEAEIKKSREELAKSEELQRAMKRVKPLEEFAPGLERIWEWERRMREGGRPEVATGAEKHIAGLEKRLEYLDAVGKAFGAQGGTDPGMLQNIKSPIQARFTDAMSFLESAQTASLNTGDAEAKRLEQQMQESLKLTGEGNGTLLNIERNLKALEAAVARLRFWEGN
jgi:hypothetical protein